MEKIYMSDCCEEEVSSRDETKCPGCGSNCGHKEMKE